MRPVLLLVAAACLLSAPGAEAAKRRPPCKRTPTLTRCLQLTRGPSPVAMTKRGTVPRAAALQAFVSVVGPLPGVKRRPGATGRITSGTGPIRWLRGYWSSLTPAQRKAAEKAIGAGGQARAHARALPNSPVQQKWQALINDAMQRLGAHFGTPMTLQVSVIIASSQPASNSALAETNAVGTTCPITIYPSGVYSSPDEQAVVAAHESAHCFQYQFGKDFWQKPTRSWIIEGGADWAGDTVAAEMLGHDPKGPVVGKWWNTWLIAPGVGLFARSYDAVGFWAHVDATEGGGWTKLRQSSSQEDENKVYENLTGFSVDGGVMNTLGTAYFRDPSLGSGFDFSGAGITNAKATIPTIEVDDGDTRTLTANPRAALARRVKVSADVLIASPVGNPWGRIREAGGDVVSARKGTSWCARKSGCECPSDSDGADLVAGLRTLPPGVLSIGIASRGAGAAHLKLRGFSLDSFCGTSGGGKGKSGSGGGSSGTSSSATKVTVTGAASAVIDSDGACSSKTDDANYLNIVFTKIVGKRVNQLTFKLKGPAPYTTPDEVRTIAFDPGGSDPNEYIPYATDTGTTDAQGYEIYQGSYELEFHKVPGGYAGTVSGTLRPPNADSPEVSVNGSWRCRAS